MTIGAWAPSATRWSNGAPEDAKYDLARPTVSTGGNLLKAWSGKIQARYPSGDWPMQFASLARGKGVLYLGTQDSDARAKDFLLETAAPGRLGIVHYVENMAVAGSDFPDYYAVELGVHAGNWVQSAPALPRVGAEAEMGVRRPRCRNAPRCPPPSRTSASGCATGWLWQGKDGTAEQRNQPLIDMQKQVGVPVGIHWYDWHHVAFDNEYPHYFPTKPGLPRARQGPHLPRSAHHAPTSMARAPT